MIHKALLLKFGSIFLLFLQDMVRVSYLILCISWLIQVLPVAIISCVCMVLSICLLSGCIFPAMLMNREYICAQKLRPHHYQFSFIETLEHFVSVLHISISIDRIRNLMIGLDQYEYFIFSAILFALKFWRIMLHPRSKIK